MKFMSENISMLLCICAFFWREDLLFSLESQVINWRLLPYHICFLTILQRFFNCPSATRKPKVVLALPILIMKAFGRSLWALWTCFWIFNYNKGYTEWSLELPSLLETVFLERTWKRRDCYLTWCFFNWIFSFILKKQINKLHHSSWLKFLSKCPQLFI